MIYLNPGEMFVDRFGPPTSGEDVLKYATFLREESGSTSVPPIDLWRVYARFGIPTPTRAPLPGQQGLLANVEQGIMVINEDDPPTRQRFTEAHELMEMLFAALPAGKGWVARSRSGVFRNDAKERLCNEGAAELLMPRESFLPRLVQMGVSYPTSRRLAAEHNGSVAAALVQMARVGPGRHAVVLWRMKNKPSEVQKQVPEEQLSLFGDSVVAGPPPKLRVEWSIGGPGAPFIPTNKSVPEDSSIFEAWQSGSFTNRKDRLDLGACQGLFQCENWPFGVGDEQLVLSLLHLPGDMGCGSDS